MPPVGPGALPQLVSASPQEAYNKTLARLDRIRNHLSTTPRSNRLKGKVCVITGVGSLKGIGFVSILLYTLLYSLNPITSFSRATALAYAHAGAKHLYLLDFDGHNLPDLKKSIESTYPDVKVGDPSLGDKHIPQGVFLN